MKYSIILFMLFVTVKAYAQEIRKIDIIFSPSSNSLSDSSKVAIKKISDEIKDNEIIYILKYENANNDYLRRDIRENEILKCMTENSISDRQIYSNGFDSRIDHKLFGNTPKSDTFSIFVITLSNNLNLFLASSEPDKPELPDSLKVSRRGFRRIFWHIKLISSQFRKYEKTLLPPISSTELPRKTLNQKCVIVPIYYATDRLKTGQKNAYNFYGSTYNESGYTKGLVNVSIPVSHAFGEIDKRTWAFWNNEFDTTKYFVLYKPKEMNENAFYAKMKEAMNASTENDAFVYIHGYNNTFAEAAERTAQLKYDLKFKGAAIMYSWPSYGNAEDYVPDGDNIKLTTDHLKDFLIKIIKNTGPRKVHIIAHSMGSRAICSALYEIQRDNPNIHFNQLILAAADIDVRDFKKMAPYITTTATRSTIYVSANDRALNYSHKFNKNSRLGQGGRNICVLNGYETVDASNLPAHDFFDHRYAIECEEVVNDINVLFRYNYSPDKRKLAYSTIRSKKYWLFK